MHPELEAGTLQVGLSEVCGLHLLAHGSVRRTPVITDSPE